MFSIQKATLRNVVLGRTAMRSVALFQWFVITVILTLVVCGCEDEKAYVPVVADIILVKPDGSGDYPTIQAAIDAASDWDIIELTDGTFTGQGNCDIEYLGKSITVRSQSGNPEACVIDCKGSVEHPHRGFFFHSGEGSESRLEGITITNGYIVDLSAGQLRGGAIRCDTSSPTLVRCKLIGNKAPAGGGISCHYGANPTMERCEISGNVEEGIYCENSSPTLRDCLVAGNQGRGMRCLSGSPELVSSSFVGNMGGGMISVNSVSRLTECLFENNVVADGFGGGFASSGGSAILFDCSLVGNVTGGAWTGGGGASVAHGTVMLEQCILVGNQCLGEGGGLHGEGGGLYCDGVVTAEGCVFFRNGAHHGGAIFCDAGAAAILQSSTLYADSVGYGGVIYAEEESAVVLERTIVSGGRGGTGLRCHSAAIVTLKCCDLYGNTEGDWVECIEGQYGVNGNIEADPQFCDPENGDFHLQPESPCSPDSSECGLIGAWGVGCE